jgi:hypothetical protein
MENKKKNAQAQLDEQILKLNDYITQRITIEAAKNDEHYADMMQKLIGVQNQIDQHSKDIKDALIKRSAESTKMHDISDKLADQHYNKLHDLVRDSNKTISTNLTGTTDAIRSGYSDLAHIFEHALGVVRFYAALTIINTAISAAILYRLLTCR